MVVEEEVNLACIMLIVHIYCSSVGSKKILGLWNNFSCESLSTQSEKSRLWREEKLWDHTPARPHIFYNHPLSPLYLYLSGDCSVKHSPLNFNTLIFESSSLSLSCADLVPREIHVETTSPSSTATNKKMHFVD